MRAVSTDAQRRHGTRLIGGSAPDRAERPNETDQFLSARRSSVTWSLIVLIVVGIVVFSLEPLPQPQLRAPWKHVPHAIAYAVLTAALLAALIPSNPPRPGRSVFIRATVIAVCVIGLGVAMELGQGPVHRDVEAGDVVADVAGAVAAFLIVFPLRGVRPSRYSARS
jgi:VanZ family protein